ncbi:MAG: hypothetical protein QHH19_03785 [Candidatus Thermoplasmatota archaeon]|nr:hypothetical protein [Candidatus Thermoplasmatota archaeon]
MKIKTRDEILRDIIKDAKKQPREWKAVFGRDKNLLSHDTYILNNKIGVYFLKEYQKNPFEVRGIGGKIARRIDEEIENEITRYTGNFGIIQGDIRRILKSLEKGVKPEKILDAAIKGKGKRFGMSMPVRGVASSSEEIFNNISNTLSTNQKKLNSKFEEIASDDGLYKNYM